MNKYIFLLCLFNIIWAGTLSAYKVLGEYLPAGTIVTIRFGLAGICMLPFWFLFKGNAPKGKDLLKTIVMGLLVFSLGHRLQVIGNNLGGAGNSAVIMALEPLLASVAAALFLRESIPAKRWAGFALGMLGVAILNGVWRTDFQWTTMGASALFISSLACETAYSIIGKPIVAKANPAKVLCLALLSGLVFNVLFEWKNLTNLPANLPLKVWILFLYLSIICTLLGYWVWLNAIKVIDVNLAALSIFIQPIAGVPMAAFFLSENIHIGQLWGGIIIGLGLLLGFSKDTLNSLNNCLNNKEENPS
ncbi:MAG: EamA family transporter [Verrucomicrobiae bacterium]|nr:EamA family transporter [Verrucomicrobiae bacterium]